MTAPIKPTIPDVLADFEAYHAKNPTWGSLHIILEDGNISNANVAYCIDRAIENGDAEGERLARLLLTMSKTQRLKLVMLR